MVRMVRCNSTRPGEVAGVAFVVELTFLPGRERLAGRDVLSLVSYDSEAVEE